jgi:hypothetical protein
MALLNTMQDKQASPGYVARYTLANSLAPVYTHTLECWYTWLSAMQRAYRH